MREDKILSFLNYLADNPVLTFVCIIFFVADIVLGTCIIYQQIHRKEMMQLGSRYAQVRESRDRLSDLLKETQAKYTQVSQQLNRIDGLSKKLTADLHTCQNTNLGFITQILKKDSAIKGLQKQLRNEEQVSGALKTLFARQLALGPTWVEASQSFTTPGGDFSIEVGNPSGMDRCPKGSTAIFSLFRGKDKKTLCVGMDRPKSFKLKGKEYSFELLGVGQSEKGRKYLISILRER